MSRIDIPALYPKMFSNCFDFSTDAGWDDILNLLCQKLQTISDQSGDQISVQQVKEKFGGLRFYASNTTTEQNELIAAAENTCDQTCEICGKPGYARNSSWIKTLCDEHDQKR